MDEKKIIFRSSIFIRSGNGFVLYRQKTTLNLETEISALEWLLKKMVEMEEFEMAAIIRDRIALLQGFASYSQQ